MELTTVEEASKCPRCSVPGELKSSRRAPERDANMRKIPTGTMVHTYACVTESCRWFETEWVVQVFPDNTVPIRERGERGAEKDFPALTPDQKSIGRATIEDIIKAEHTRNE